MILQKLHTEPSCPAKAGGPVRRGVSILPRRLWNTGSPAGACHPAGRRPDRLAGDDDRGVSARRGRKVFEHPPLVIPRACGVTSTPRPLGVTALSLGYWVARSSRAMTTEGMARIFKQPNRDTTPHSRGTMRPSFAKRCRHLKNRGRGECLVPNAPAASCALCSWSIHSGGTGYIRHSPRNGFTAYIALSPGTGLFCPRHFRGIVSLRKLSASVGAPGPHDFAVRFGTLVSRHRCVHRIPLPTSVTIAIRPSCGCGMPGRIHNFRFSEREIFVRGGLTTQISLNPLAKLNFTRTRFGNEKAQCPKR
jgi:hypothetical protein